MVMSDYIARWRGRIKKSLSVRVAEGTKLSFRSCWRNHWKIHYLKTNCHNCSVSWNKKLCFKLFKPMNWSCMCICEHIRMLFVCIFVFLCFALLCLCNWGVCDNRHSALKAVGNVPLDKHHFIARGFGHASQVSLIATALN